MDKKTSFDIISEAIDHYYDTIRRYPDIVCFFKQRYEGYENDWESVEVLVTTNSNDGFAKPTTIIYDYDFCEGQTEVKDIYISELFSVLAFNHEHLEELKEFDKGELIL